jgi:long-chain acyl-CoA synthetase
VFDKIWLEIERLNEHFGHWEKIKKFALLPDEFTIDGGEMTPKLSLKRKVILTKNAELIDRIYAEGAKQEHHV